MYYLFVCQLFFLPFHCVPVLSKSVHVVPLTTKIVAANEVFDIGTTCYKLPSGLYGYCPTPHAVCCSDKIHCCPHGYICFSGGRTCNKMPVEPLLHEISLVAEKLMMPNGCKTMSKCTMCPDGSECPNYYTCCQLNGGGYGCCKYNMAICCSDHFHCCPQGTQCDLKKQVCRSQNSKQLFDMLYLPADQTL